MHERIDEIKKNEGKPKVIKNIFSDEEINKFKENFIKIYLSRFIIKNKMLLKKDGSLSTEKN